MDTTLPLVLKSQLSVMLVAIRFHQLNGTKMTWKSFRTTEFESLVSVDGDEKPFHLNELVNNP